jgi:hypothetical protein
MIVSDVPHESGGSPFPRPALRHWKNAGQRSSKNYAAMQHGGLCLLYALVGALGQVCSKKRHSEQKIGA